MLKDIVWVFLRVCRSFFQVVPPSFVVEVVLCASFLFQRNVG